MAMTRKIPLLLALALGLLLPSAAAAYLPPGFIGISPQGQTNKSDFELMREADVDSVRLPFVWSAVQPHSPVFSEPNWSGLDHEVELAAEAGIRVMPFVFGTPSWAGPESVTLPVRSAWQRGGWATFLHGAENHYGPGGSFWDDNPDLPYLPIRNWEIWNEENIVSFAGKPDPVGYADLVRNSGRLLHRADPGSKVILGGLFGRPLQVPPNVASGDFLSRFYRAHDVKQYFDGVALHPYVARARAMGGELDNLRRIMRVHNDSATPIYLTELGWGSHNGPTRWERGLQGQANQLSESFSLLSVNRLRWNVAGAWWFTWNDVPDTCSFCTSAGLLTAKREAKPAWYRFNAWTGGDPDTVPKARFGDVEGFEEAEAGAEAPAGEAVVPAGQ
jgi:hypothetical protein